MATLTVVAIAVGMFVWLSLADGSDSAVVNVPEEKNEASQVASALEVLESDPESLLPPELVGDVGVAEIETALPPGTKVTADEESWQPSTVGGGAIQVDLEFPNGTTSQVVAIMSKYPDGWKVLQTVPVGTTP